MLTTCWLRVAGRLTLQRWFAQERGGRALQVASHCSDFTAKRQSWSCRPSPLQSAIWQCSNADTACGAGQDTVDTSLPACICPLVYAPVCGSDGRTYSNSCEADCAGVKYTQGACEADVLCICTAEYAPVCGDDGKVCHAAWVLRTPTCARVYVCMRGCTRRAACAAHARCGMQPQAVHVTQKQAGPRTHGRDTSRLASLSSWHPAAGPSW